MKKKLPARDAKLLLYFIGVAVLLLVYNYQFIPSQEENSRMEQEVNALIVQKGQLELMNRQKETYQSKIEEMQTKIDEVVAQYPVEIRQEDGLAYAIELEEKEKVTINALSYEGNELYYEMGKGNLYRQPVTYNFSGSYENVKNMIAYVQEDEEKKNISALTLGYGQEDGNLIGTMTVNLYSLDGTDKVYEEPQVSGVKSGKKNLFDSK